MSILWSAQAEQDLDGIHAYIARDSERHADLQIKQIILRVVYVASHPMSGHPVHEYPKSGLREVHSASYRIIYQVSEDRFTVVTVVHMKQRLARRRLGGA